MKQIYVYLITFVYDFFSFIMNELLYGTYLTFKVKEVLDANQRPMTVREVTNKIARLPRKQQENLCRRVRNALNTLVFQEHLSREIRIDRDKNHTFFTYQNIAHESSKKAPERANGESKKPANAHGNAQTLSSSD